MSLVLFLIQLGQNTNQNGSQSSLPQLMEQYKQLQNQRGVIEERRKYLVQKTNEYNFQQTRLIYIQNDIHNKEIVAAMKTKLDETKAALDAFISSNPQELRQANYSVINTLTEAIHSLEESLGNQINNVGTTLVDNHLASLIPPSLSL